MWTSHRADVQDIKKKKHDESRNWEIKVYDKDLFRILYHTLHEFEFGLDNISTNYPHRDIITPVIVQAYRVH